MTQTFGPYSPIRQVGELFFISGQIGVDADKKASDNIADQTNQALDNLGAVLESAGLTFDDVVKTTIFVTDMGDFAKVNEVYVARFADPRPARSTVGVAELPRVANVPLKVEIEVIAAKGNQPIPPVVRDQK
jgi:2-iminobutanoate/2-iminopropanoate deaminase